MDWKLILNSMVGCLNNSENRVGVGGRYEQNCVFYLVLNILVQVSVNFISLVTSESGVELLEEEPQTAYPFSFTWTSHIAASVLIGR